MSFGPIGPVEQQAMKMIRGTSYYNEHQGTQFDNQLVGIVKKMFHNILRFPHRNKATGDLVLLERSQEVSGRRITAFVFADTPAVLKKSRKKLHRITFPLLESEERKAIEIPLNVKLIFVLLVAKTDYFVFRRASIDYSDSTVYFVDEVSLQKKNKAERELRALERKRKRSEKALEASAVNFFLSRELGSTLRELELKKEGEWEKRLTEALQDPSVSAEAKREVRYYYQLRKECARGGYWSHDPRSRRDLATCVYRISCVVLGDEDRAYTQKHTYLSVEELVSYLEISSGRKKPKVIKHRHPRSPFFALSGGYGRA